MTATNPPRCPRLHVPQCAPGPTPVLQLTESPQATALNPGHQPSSSGRPRTPPASLLLHAHSLVRLAGLGVVVMEADGPAPAPPTSCQPRQVAGQLLAPRDPGWRGGGRGALWSEAGVGSLSSQTRPLSPLGLPRPPGPADEEATADPPNACRWGGLILPAASRWLLCGGWCPPGVQAASGSAACLLERLGRRRGEGEAQKVGPGALLQPPWGTHGLGVEVVGGQG